LPSLGAPPPIRLANRSAMMAEWNDPADMAPSATRTARSIRGYRGFDPLRKCLKRHGDASSITEQHIVAADLLRGMADGAAIGFSTERDLSLPVTAILCRPSKGPGPTALRQERCWRHFVRTMAIFTAAERVLVMHVVLLNRSVQRWCQEREAQRGLPVSPAKVMGQLVSCLDRLVEHLDSEVHEAINRGAAA
jgi:hypothetical protein